MSKQVITKSNFLQDLEDGLTRKQMAEKYETTSTAINKGIKIFGLENARAKKNYNIEFVDDTQFESVEITQEQIAEKVEAIEEIVNEEIVEEPQTNVPIDIDLLFGTDSNTDKQLITETEVSLESNGFPGISIVND